MVKKLYANIILVTEMGWGSHYCVRCPILNPRVGVINDLDWIFQHFTYHNLNRLQHCKFVCVFMHGFACVVIYVFYKWSISLLVCVCCVLKREKKRSCMVLIHHCRWTHLVNSTQIGSSVQVVVTLKRQKNNISWHIHYILTFAEW